MTRKRVRTFFAVSIELGRNVKHRIAVRLHGELKKGWTPCSESLEIEAGKEPKGAVRQRQRLDKQHPHLPRDYYRKKMQALKLPKREQGITWSKLSRRVR